MRDRHAAALALPLMLLLSAALLPALAQFPGPFGDDAVVSAPAGYAASWSSNQELVHSLPGFCLSEAEGRVLRNWSAPLYRRRIVMAAEGTSGMPFVWSWILKLLVQEVIGHQVWWYDPGASTDTFYNRLVLDPLERRSDVEIQSYLQPTAPTEHYRLHVTGSGEVVQKGAHSQTNQGGIYLTRSSMVRHPQYAMESWRAFCGGENALFVDPLYPDGALLQLFRTDSWAVLDSFRNVWGQDMLYEYSGEAVCRPVMVGRDGVPFETGCTDTNYTSMYFPPQCYPNPREQCALIFAVTPVWLGSYMQGQVRSLNLSLGIAFLNVAAFGLEELITNSAQRHLLMYADGNQAPTNTDCAFGTKKLPCWHRMQLPTYTSLCTDSHNGSFTSGYACDFPLWQQVKYARSDLVVEAPRVDHFLQQFDMGPADTFWFFNQPELQSGWPQDHKSVACRWIRQAANRARWEAWIAPPAACTVDDTEFVASECDEATAKLELTYSWKLPKACVGGWALPQTEHLSCGYVTTSLSWQVACMSVAGVLLVALAFATSMRALESVYMLLSARRAAAASLMARSQLQAATKTRGTVTVAPLSTSASTLPLASQSLFVRAIANRRHMPIFALCGAAIYPLNIACMLLLLVPFVQLGPVAESMCWLRYAFTVVGVVTVLQVLASLLVTLTSNLNRSLDSNAAKGLRRIVAATHVVLVVSMLVAGLSDGDANALAVSMLVVAPGGGSALLDRCTPPVVWLAVLHVAVVLVWAVLVAVPLTRILIRVHFSRVMPRKSGAAHKKNKMGSGSITRTQLVQTNSIAATFIIWVVASALLLVPLYASVEATRVEATLMTSSIVVLLGTSLCCAALFGPSWWHVRGMARSGPAAGKNQVAALTGTRNAVRTVGSATLVTGGNANRVVSSSHASQPSVNASSTHSDMLTGDVYSTHDDRDVSVSLASVLRDPVLLLHFRRFAESSFDPEPVHFLLQCQALYRQLKGATLNLTQVLGGLEAICDEFIVDGAPQQVNIGSALRASTLAAVQEVRLAAVTQARNRLKPASAQLKAQARACLQDAVSEVYALVQVNSYPRFLNSSALGRSQHLLRWADGLDELDEEEQAAMMAKLRDTYAQAVTAARKLAEDNGNGAYANVRLPKGSSADSGGPPGRPQGAAGHGQGQAAAASGPAAAAAATRLRLRESMGSVPYAYTLAAADASRSQAPHDVDTPTCQLGPNECSESPHFRYDPASPLAAAAAASARLSTAPLESTRSPTGGGGAPAPAAHLVIDVLSDSAGGAAAVTAAAAGDTRTVTATWTPGASPSLVHETCSDYQQSTLPGSTHT